MTQVQWLAGAAKDADAAGSRTETLNIGAVLLCIHTVILNSRHQFPVPYDHVYFEQIYLNNNNIRVRFIDWTHRE